MQSRWQVITVTGAAVIVAVALFLVLRNDGDSDSTTRPVATSEGPVKKEPPQKQDKPKPKPEPGGTTIAFKNGAPVGGVQEIEVSSGDEVRIRVTSDSPAEIHVHGYDLVKEAVPGQPATFDFPATIEGGFEIEAHAEEHVEIASLTVTP